MCSLPFGGLGDEYSDLESRGKFPRHCSLESSIADLFMPSDLSRGVGKLSFTSRLSVHLFNQV